MNPPSTSEELERKTVETIDWLVNQTKNGFMSEDQMGIASETLWRATSGLFPSTSNMAEVMTELMSMVDSEAAMRRYHFINSDGDQILTIAWNVGYSSFNVFMRKLGVVTGGSVKRYPSSATAKTKLEEMAKALIARGWSQL